MFPSLSHATTTTGKPVSKTHHRLEPPQIATTITLGSETTRSSLIAFSFSQEPHHCHRHIWVTKKLQSCGDVAGHINASPKKSYSTHSSPLVAFGDCYSKCVWWREKSIKEENNFLNFN